MGFLQLLELGGVSGGIGLGIGKLLAELHGTGQMLLGQCLVLLALAGDALDARGQARDLVLEAGLCLAQCVQLLRGLTQRYDLPFARDRRARSRSAVVIVALGRYP